MSLHNTTASHIMSLLIVLATIFMYSKVGCTIPPADLGLYPSISSASRAQFLNMNFLGNPSCEYNGNHGTCYGGEACLALAGNFGNFCPDHEGLCCLFYRTCGMRTSQEFAYFHNVQYPMSDVNQESCSFQVVKRSQEYCGLQVEMEEMDLPTPTRQGKCITSFQVTSIHNNFDQQCGKLSGHTYMYDISNVDSIMLHVSSSLSQSLKWKMKVKQVLCQDYFGDNTNDQVLVGVGDARAESQGSEEFGGSIGGNKGTGGTSGGRPRPMPGCGRSHGGCRCVGCSGVYGSSKGNQEPRDIAEIGGSRVTHADDGEIGGGSTGASNGFVQPATPTTSTGKCGQRGRPFDLESWHRLQGARRIHLQGPIWDDEYSSDKPVPGVTTRKNFRPKRRRGSISKKRRREQLKTQSAVQGSVVSSMADTQPTRGPVVTRPIVTPPIVGNQISSRPAVSTMEWGVPELNDTLFAHYYEAVRHLGIFSNLKIVKLSGLKEFPWQAAIIIDGQFHCGATIIDKRHVLTAAHCVKSYSSKPHAVMLSLGDWDLSSTTDGPSTNVTAEKISYHPDYSEKNLQNDVAVIRTSQDIIFTDDILPACLPEGDIPLEGQLATISGWGRDERGNLQPQLHYVNVEIISNKACNTSWNEGVAEGFIDPSMICMTAAGENSCIGDSGGPSVIETSPGSRTYWLVGIVSFGTPEFCLDSSLPGVHSRVSHFKKWIQDQMN